EDELVAACQVCPALDLGDDALADLGNHPTGELAADDAAVEERLTGRQPPLVVEQREPRRRPAPARRAVDLAGRADGHVPLGQRLLALLLPEDDAVDVSELRLARMDDVVLALQVVLDRPPELDQPG